MTGRSMFAVAIALLLAGGGYAAEQLVAARVNDAVVTERDVINEVNRLIPVTTYHARITPERQQEFREKALENLIDRELQYQDALRLKLVPDKKAVNEELDGIRDRFKSKKEFREALQSAGITEDGLRRIAERNSLVKLVIDRVVVQSSRVRDDEVRALYDANPSRVSVPDAVRIRIMSSKDKGRLVAALGRLQAGEDFGTVAAQVSEDNYRIKGGDIGYVHRGRLVPAIETEAFSLKPGSVSGMIAAEGKWFLLKVEDRKDAYRKSYDEAKEGLKKDMERQRADEIMKKWMEGLRAQARIDIIKSLPAGTRPDQ